MGEVRRSNQGPVLQTVTDNLITRRALFLLWYTFDGSCDQELSAVGSVSLP